MSKQDVKVFLESVQNILSLVTFTVEDIKSLDNIESQKKQATFDLALEKSNLEEIKLDVEKAKKELLAVNKKISDKLEQAENDAAQKIADADAVIAKNLAVEVEKLTKAKSELEGLEAKKKAIEEAVSLAKAEHDLIDGKIAQLKSDLKGFVGG